MIKDQVALIRRELWEHRSIYLTPAIIALLMSLGTVTGQAIAVAEGAVVEGVMKTTGNDEPQGYVEKRQEKKGK